MNRPSKLSPEHQDDVLVYYDPTSTPSAYADIVNALGGQADNGRDTGHLGLGKSNVFKRLDLLAGQLSVSNRPNDCNSAAPPTAQSGDGPERRPSAWVTGEVGYGKGFSLKRHSDGKDHR